MKIKSFLAASVAAMALFASCSNEDDNKGIEPIDGVKTMAKITLTQTANHTRATVDASTPEKAIGDVMLYIFNNASVLEKVVNFTGLTSNAFEITTGTKTFLVAANMKDASLPTFTVGSTTLTTIKTAISNINVTAISAAATANKFWMTSLDDTDTATLTVATEDDVDAGTNNITLNVGRAVAKVGVYFNPTVQLDGTLTSVKYMIHNNPNKMRLFTSNDASGYRVTPYYDYDKTTVPVAANYFKSSTDYLAVETAAFIDEPVNPSYMMENSNLIPREGNATMVVIKGTFTPTKLHDANGVVSTASFSTGNVFYRVYNSDTREYGDKYYNAVPTPAEMTAAGCNGIAKYTGGTCYYALWLRDTEKATKVARYTVPRNTFWNVTITSVTGAGSNTDTTDPGATDPEDPNTPGPGVVDPNVPLDVDTWMKAEISVANWTSVTQVGGI